MYTFQTADGGYRIFQNGQLIIDQPFDPSKEGFHAFEDPAKAAEEAIKRLMPPPIPKLICVLHPVDANCTVNNLEATLKLGSGVRATFWLEIQGVKLSNFSGHFRLPIQPIGADGSYAGPAVLREVEISNGEGTVDFYPKSTVTYVINNETITCRLAPSEMMHFDGEIRITCLEA